MVEIFSILKALPLSAYGARHTMRMITCLCHSMLLSYHAFSVTYSVQLIFQTDDSKTESSQSRRVDQRIKIVARNARLILCSLDE
jgi:hypothetical protein